MGRGGALTRTQLRAQIQERQAHAETTLGAAVDARRARLPAKRGAELRTLSDATPDATHTLNAQVRRRPVVGPLPTVVPRGTPTRKRRAGRRDRSRALRLRHVVCHEGRGVVRDAGTLESTEAAADLRELGGGAGGLVVAGGARGSRESGLLGRCCVLWRRRGVFFSSTDFSGQSGRAVPILVHPGDAARGDERAISVRLDMAVALSCPLVVGYLSKRHGGLRGLHCHDDDCHAHHFGAAAALAVSHVIGGVAVFICSGKFRSCLSDSPPPSPRSVIPKSPSKLEGLNAVKKLDPFARGCLDCYCLLYFTVLSPHGVTVAWLRGVRRTDAAVIGLFQTLAQGAGLLATFFTPFVVERTGARKAAAACRTLHKFCAALSVFALYHGHEKVFLAGLCASRFGLWAFDLLEREILQTAAASDDQCMALFAEQSRRTSAASFLIFGASAYLSDAEKFPYLLGVAGDARRVDARARPRRAARGRAREAGLGLVGRLVVPHVERATRRRGGRAPAGGRELRANVAVRALRWLRSYRLKPPASGFSVRTHISLRFRLGGELRRRGT